MSEEQQFSNEEKECDFLWSDNQMFDQIGYINELNRSMCRYLGINEYSSDREIKSKVKSIQLKSHPGLTKKIPINESLEGIGMQLNEMQSKLYYCQIMNVQLHETVQQLNIMNGNNRQPNDDEHHPQYPYYDTNNDSICSQPQSHNKRKFSTLFDVQSATNFNNGVVGVGDYNTNGSTMDDDNISILSVNHYLHNNISIGRKSKNDYENNAYKSSPVLVVGMQYKQINNIVIHGQQKSLTELKTSISIPKSEKGSPVISRNLLLKYFKDKILCVISADGVNEYCFLNYLMDSPYVCCDSNKMVKAPGRPLNSRNKTVEEKEIATSYKQQLKMIKQEYRAEQGFSVGELGRAVGTINKKTQDLLNIYEQWIRMLQAIGLLITE